jgi:hypothetical protein
MPKNRDQIEQEIEASEGKDQTAVARRNASTRVCGLLVARGRSKEWDEAYVHIAEHFERDPQKPKHTVFNKKYRDQEALRGLLLRAASGPSAIRLTKLTIDGEPVGRPAVEILRLFGEEIGDSAELVCLRIFVDFQGKLITAYPGTRKEI